MTAPTLSRPAEPAPRAAATPARAPLAVGIVAALAALKLALHLTVLAVTRFGVHRDEFLYFSMGRHLRLFGMDFPPMIAILANAARAIFGDALASVRVFPAVEGTVLLVLATLIARELGGGRFAQALAALCILGGALFQRSATLFQPVVLDQIWWTLGLLALARLARAHAEGDAGGERRRWLLFGVCCGFGLLTKFSILFFGLAALVAILLTPLRRAFLTPWPWLAAAIVLLIGSPSIAGQLALGFPVVGQMHDLQQTQLEHVSWWSFVAEQPLMIGPVSFLLALAGAWWLVAGSRGDSEPRRRSEPRMNAEERGRESRAFSAFFRVLPRSPAEIRARPFLVVGLTCILAFLLLLVLHGKAYYIGPIYPTLTAAGAVALERVQRRPLGPVLRWGTAAGVVLLGLLVLPLGVPILGVEATARYAHALGVSAAVKTNRGVVQPLPQDFADMLGWEEQSRAAARALAALAPDERREAVLIGDNYGEAAALEFYADRHGFADIRVVSAAGSFWFWGPGDKPGRVVVSLGDEPEDLAHFARDVRLVEHVRNPWGVEEEQDVEVVVCRDPKTTLQAIWPSLAGRN